LGRERYLTVHNSSIAPTIVEVEVEVEGERAAIRLPA
jgi:hypothetical protein